MRLLFSFCVCVFTIFNTITFIGVIPLAFAKSNSSLKSLSGFKRTPSSILKTYSGEILRYFDEGESFFILIEGKAAFYRFPKSKESEAAVRSFLDQKIKTNTKIKIEVDVKTAQIMTLGE